MKLQAEMLKIVYKNEHFETIEKIEVIPRNDYYKKTKIASTKQGAFIMHYFIGSVESIIQGYEGWILSTVLIKHLGT